MSASKGTAVVGVFQSPSNAQDAIRALRSAGFTDAHIGVISPHKEAEEASNKGAKVSTGVAVGAGAAAGVAALWSLGISFSVIPVIGPILAAGPIAAALLSAAGGAAAGGIVGALTGLGVAKAEAEYYEKEMHAGRTLVTVHADGRDDEAWKILERHGAYNKSHPATTHA